jgi:hypothetical protein
MLSFMISCKKSSLLSNSFVFSLIALNAKAINFFDEKNENERADERTKKRKNAYELKKKTNVMMKKKTFEMMMMMKERRNQANKKKNRRRNQKMKKKKEEKKRFNYDSFVMMRRFKNEMRFFIFENLRKMFFVFRFNTTMFSFIFINFFTRFEIWYCECCWKNVNSNDEKKRKNHCWWLMKNIERTEIVIEIKWALMKKNVLRILGKNVLKILTRILTTILKTILKTRILWIQNSLIYTSFFFSI